MNLPPTNGLLGRFKNVNDADLEDGNVDNQAPPHIKYDPHGPRVCSQTAAMMRETWRTAPITDYCFPSIALHTEECWI
jgi:hypothetical protein